ncbi:MAG: hypothetical protein P1P84_01695 [Deferrisomatales bacterium]|nr:hypothetical protein [Deferrisomatales bacterium]
MTETVHIQISLERRPVTLHYPGADGVQFHDAVLVLSNPTGEAARDVGLHLRVLQGDAPLLDGPVDLSALGCQTEIAAGEALRLSVFRTLQHHVRGFGSKVNMFGYKAVLNWTFRVEASLSADQGEHRSGAWKVEWHPSAGDPALVEVDIAPA